jgi:putative ABC transport system substrate-binding protein
MSIVTSRRAIFQIGVQNTLWQEVLQNWQVAILPEKHSMMKITPKWQGTEKLPPQKILGLIPKPSDSYSLASAKLLQVLYDEGVYAVITLINFNKDNKLGKAALQLAEQENMNLIFSMGSESATFLYEFYNGGKIPVVTCTNKDPVLLHQVADYEGGSGTNIAYISLNVPIDVQIKYLTDLIPELKNLGILYDRNHSQVVATEVMPTQEKLHQMNVTVIDIAVSSKETASDELRKNMAVALALMQKTDAELKHSVFWVTSSTLVFSNMATVAQAAGKVPVLSSIPNIVTGKEDSAVMAIGIDRRNNAYLASIYAVKILKGQAKAGEFKVGIITPPDIAISFRIAQQINFFNVRLYWSNLIQMQIFNFSISMANWVMGLVTLAAKKYTKTMESKKIPKEIRLTCRKRALTGANKSSSGMMTRIRQSEMNDGGKNAILTM